MCGGVCGGGGVLSGKVGIRGQGRFFRTSGFFYVYDRPFLFFSFFFFLEKSDFALTFSFWRRYNSLTVLVHKELCTPVCKSLPDHIDIVINDFEVLAYIKTKQPIAKIKHYNHQILYFTK